MPKKIRFTNGEFENLNGKIQHSYCGWDDVTAMYRKLALIEIPFKETNFAEDSLWAKDAFIKGYTLVYDYNARVIHYHHNTFKFTFRRTYTIQYHTRLYFNYHRKYENFFIRLLKVFHQIYGKGYAPERSIFWTVYNLKLLIAHYSAILVFRINTFLFNSIRQEKFHEFWVGQPPQAKSV